MRATIGVLVALTGVTAMAITLAAGHSKSELSGQAIYEANCANCHSGGFGGFFTGAPKVGRREDWAELIPKGVDTLTANTIAGIGKMEPRGQCESCSDEELRAAVEYMVSASQ
jgi:cytochrome c5